MKLVFNDTKTGKSFQKEVEKSKEGALLNKKIGDEVPGSMVGLDGYTLQVTGGSTLDGTPMRQDIPASRYVNALLSTGPGLREKIPKGARVKKRVAGSVIGPQTALVNAKILQYGSKPLSELGFAPKEKPKEEKPKEAAKAEKKSEEKK